MSVQMNDASAIGNSNITFYLSVTDNTNIQQFGPYEARIVCQTTLAFGTFAQTQTYPINLVGDTTTVIKFDFSHTSSDAACPFEYVKATTCSSCSGLISGLTYQNPSGLQSFKADNPQLMQTYQFWIKIRYYYQNNLQQTGNAQKSQLIVECGLTSTTLTTTWTNFYQVKPLLESGDQSFDFPDSDFTSSHPGCPIDYRKMSKKQNDAQFNYNSFDNMISTQNSGIWQNFLKNSDSQVTKTGFWLHVFAFGADPSGQIASWVSPELSLTLVCGIGSTTVTAPAIVANSPGKTYKRKNGIGTRLYIIPNQFTTSNSNDCPLTSLSIVPISTGQTTDYTSTDGLQVPTIITLVSDNLITVQIPASQEAGKFYLFRIKGVAEGLEEAFTDDINVYLYQCSLAIITPPTIPANTPPYPYLEIHANSQSLYSILGTFTSDETERCTITSLEIQPITGGVVGDYTSTSGTLVSINSGTLLTSPTIDIDIPAPEEQTRLYQFRVKMVFQGAAFSYTNDIFIKLIDCSQVTLGIPTKLVPVNAALEYELINPSDVYTIGQITTITECPLVQITIVPSLIGASFSQLDYTSTDGIGLATIITTVSDPTIQVKLPAIQAESHLFTFNIQGSTAILSNYITDIQIRFFNCAYITKTIPAILPNTIGLQHLELLTQIQQLSIYMLPTQFQSSLPVQCGLQSLEIVPIVGGFSQNYTSTDQSTMVSINSTINDAFVSIVIPGIQEATRLFTFRVKATYVNNIEYSADIFVYHLNCEYLDPWVDQSLPLVEISLMQFQASVYSIDFSTWFTTNRTDCTELMTYDIVNLVKIQQNQNIQWIQTMSINSTTGIFTVDDVTVGLSKSKLYVQAFPSSNKFAGSNIVEIATIEIIVPLPNMQPVFQNPLVDQVFQLVELENNQFEYTLPDYEDPNGDLVQISVTGMPSFMTFIQEFKKIQLEGDILAGTYNLYIDLADYEKINRYQLAIQVNDPVQDNNQTSNDTQATEETQSESTTSLSTQTFNINLFKFNINKNKKVEKVEVDEIEKVRKPVSMKIVEINANGEVTILFSEKLKSLQDIAQSGIDLNMTILNQIKDEVLSINYYTFVEANKTPAIEEWTIQNFTNFQLVLKVKFANPLYVSTSQSQKDLFNVEIINNNLFMSYTDFELISENFTLSNFTVSSQAKSEEEFKSLSSLGSDAKNSMLFTLVVPFCFMIFMSVSMNRVWSLYLMLQIACNILNHPRLVIPANAQYILQIMSNIANFKLLQEPNVQLWIQENIFGEAQELQQILLESTLVFGLIIVSVLIVIYNIMYRFIKNSPIIAKIKRKIMWSSVLRGQIQFYLPTCLVTFEYFRISSDSVFTIITMPGSMIKLIVILGLPIFSFYKLLWNVKSLETPEFTLKYGTLYTNINPKKAQSYKMTTIFCLKRILLGLATVYLNTFTLASTYVYIYTSIFSMGYIAYNKPMLSRGMNVMEQINEFAIYLSGIMLFLFTDWIPEIETRYMIGQVYNPGLLMIIFINISYVVWEMCQPFVLKWKQKNALERKLKRQAHDKKVKKEKEALDKAEATKAAEAKELELRKIVPIEIPEVKKTQKKRKKKNVIMKSVLEEPFKSRQQALDDLQKDRDAFQKPFQVLNFQQSQQLEISKLSMKENRQNNNKHGMFQLQYQQMPQLQEAQYDPININQTPKFQAEQQQDREEIKIIDQFVPQEKADYAQMIQLQNEIENNHVAIQATADLKQLSIKVKILEEKIVNNNTENDLKILYQQSSNLLNQRIEERLEQLQEQYGKEINAIDDTLCYSDFKTLRDIINDKFQGYRNEIDSLNSNLSLDQNQNQMSFQQ